jgi:Septum formation
VSRRWGVLLAAIVGVVAVVGVAMWWLFRPDPVPAKAPASAPPLGSCWQVEPAAAAQAFPWSGAVASCTARHTAEVYYVGQADHDLVRRSRGTGDNAKIAANLMLAEVRRACGGFASGYLGSSWHQARVTIVADWIGSQRDGFFGCALAETTDAAGTRFATRTRSLKGAADNLAAACALDGGYTPCDQPHNGEFVGTYTVTPADAPFDATGLKNTVSRGCGDVVRTYLGLPADAARPDLTAGYVGPTTAQTWLGSDQTFACYAVSADRMRGTVRSLGTRPLPR